METASAASPKKKRKIAVAVGKGEGEGGDEDDPLHRFIQKTDELLQNPDVMLSYASNNKRSILSDVAEQITQSTNKQWNSQKVWNDIHMEILSIRCIRRLSAALHSLGRGSALNSVVGSVARKAPETIQMILRPEKDVFDEFMKHDTRAIANMREAALALHAASTRDYVDMCNVEALCGVTQFVELAKTEYVKNPFNFWLRIDGYRNQVAQRLVAHLGLEKLTIDMKKTVKAVIISENLPLREYPLLSEIWKENFLAIKLRDEQKDVIVRQAGLWNIPVFSTRSRSESCVIHKFIPLPKIDTWPGLHFAQKPIFAGFDKLNEDLMSEFNQTIGQAIERTTGCTIQLIKSLRKHKGIVLQKEDDKLLRNKLARVNIALSDASPRILQNVIPSAMFMDKEHACRLAEQTELTAQPLPLSQSQSPQITVYLPYGTSVADDLGIVQKIFDIKVDKININEDNEYFFVDIPYWIKDPTRLNFICSDKAANAKIAFERELLQQVQREFQNHQSKSRINLPDLVIGPYESQEVILVFDTPETIHPLRSSTFLQLALFKAGYKDPPVMTLEEHMALVIILRNYSNCSNCSNCSNSPTVWLIGKYAKTFESCMSGGSGSGKVYTEHKIAKLLPQLPPCDPLRLEIMSRYKWIENQAPLKVYASGLKYQDFCLDPKDRVLFSMYDNAIGELLWLNDQFHFPFMQNFPDDFPTSEISPLQWVLIRVVCRGEGRTDINKARAAVRKCKNIKRDALAFHASFLAHKRGGRIVPSMFHIVFDSLQEAEEAVEKVEKVANVQNKKKEKQKHLVVNIWKEQCNKELDTLLLGEIRSTIVTFDTNLFDKFQPNFQRTHDLKGCHLKYLYDSEKSWKRSPLTFAILKNHFVRKMR